MLLAPADVKIKYSGVTQNIAPIMTSDATPSPYVASATSEFNTIDRRACDVFGLSVGKYWISSGNVPQFLKLDLSNYSIWGQNSSAIVEGTNAGPYNMGFPFSSSVAGVVNGVWFYKSSNDTGTHVGYLWSAGGTNLVSVTFTGETASGWQYMAFGSPYSISANTTYIISVDHPANFSYSNRAPMLTNPITAGPITIPASGGRYVNTLTAFPTNVSTSNYWTDISFTPTPQITRTVTAYAITSESTPERSPATWTFAGSTDNSAWTTLDTQTTVAIWAPFETRTFTIGSPGAYRYYRVNVTANNGATIVGIGKLDLFVTTTAGSVGIGMPWSALGGYISLTPICQAVDGLVAPAYDQIYVTNVGSAQYRCLFAHNTNTTTVWSGGTITTATITPGGYRVELGVDPTPATAYNATVAQALTVGSGTTAPTGVVFGEPAGGVSSVALGDIQPGYCRAFWIRFTPTVTARPLISGIQMPGGTLASVPGPAAANAASSSTDIKLRYSNSNSAVPPMGSNTSIVPNMSGYTTPWPYYVTGTNDNWVAWRAFNVNQLNNTVGYATSNANSGILTIDFGYGNAPIITQYSIMAWYAGWGNNDQSPLTWTFQGSNNNSSWTTLTVTGTTTNAGAWSADEVRKYPVTSPVAYRWHRVNVTAVQTAGNIVNIAQFGLTTGVQAQASTEYVWGSGVNKMFGYASNAFGLYPANFVNTGTLDWPLLGITTNEWASTAMPAWIQIDLGATGTASTIAGSVFTPGPQTITQYRMVGKWTASFPTSWILYGSTNWDGSATAPNVTYWTPIDSQTLTTASGNGEARYFTVAAPGSYRWYRFNISATSTGSTIAELMNITLYNGAGNSQAGALASSLGGFVSTTTWVTPSLNHGLYPAIGTIAGPTTQIANGPTQYRCLFAYNSGSNIYTNGAIALLPSQPIMGATATALTVDPAPATPANQATPQSSVISIYQTAPPRGIGFTTPTYTYTPVNLSDLFTTIGLVTLNRPFVSGNGVNTAGLTGAPSVALIANYIGSNPSFGGTPFIMGPVNANSALPAIGQTILLPNGNYVAIQIAAATMHGPMPNGTYTAVPTFTINYTDGSTGVFTSNCSDWAISSYYGGESLLAGTPLANYDGSINATYQFGIYIYTFNLDPHKTVSSIILPTSAVVPGTTPTINVFAMTLIGGTPLLLAPLGDIPAGYCRPIWFRYNGR